MSLLRRDALPLREELALVEPPIRREECQDVAHVLEIVDLVRSAPRRQGALGMGREGVRAP